MRYLVIFSPLLTLVAGLVLGIVYGLQPEPLPKPMNRLTPFDCQRLFKTPADQQLFADALWSEFPNDPTVDPQGRTVAKRIDLLTRDGRFAGAIGSAGGNAILAYVGKSLVAALDWNLPMQDALAQPNLVARGPRFMGEVTKFSPEMLAALRSKGVDLKPGQGEDSGVHGVLIRDGQVDGGYDPRREGAVLLLGG